MLFVPDWYRVISSAGRPLGILGGLLQYMPQCARLSLAQNPQKSLNPGGSGSVVEHRLAKARVAGSNPVFRSIFLPNGPFIG